MPSMAGFSHQRSLCHANSNVETSSLDNRNVRWSKGRNDPLRRRQEIAKQRRSLPIASVEQRIVEEVRKNDTLVIVGETGSGKTTQLPQFLFSGGFCRDGKVIGITQPRRVAAVTVAKRVSEECGVELGQKVGYSIRFEDVTSSATRIKYMTDGMLLREALLDPLLSKYSVVIVDEAHERTVHTDVLLGILKSVQKSRSQQVMNKDNVKNIDNIDSNEDTSIGIGNGWKGQASPSGCPLKLIVMSASLDARGFSEYLGGAKAVHIQGRKYPVDILYTYTPQQDYIDAALITIFQIHLEEDSGDILVFLTGQEEIESVERLVLDRCQHLADDSKKIFTVPIYSALPSEQQMQAFKPAPHGFRKVILATNIAETSVTIPGIKYVVDPGLVKARSYHPHTGMESLVIVPISKAQALQRSGRAGREGPGKCFRLYTEDEFDKLKDSTEPEIKRCSLSNVVLQLKALGIDDVLGFDFIDKPSRMAIVKSLEQLYALGALTDEGKLSDPGGHHMARLPLDAMYAKALIQASTFNCLEEMLIAVAMLSVESIFYFPREKIDEARAATKCFLSSDGDHITLVNVFRAAVDSLQKTEGLVSTDVKSRSSERKLNKWCKDNFINSRSLKHALDIHRQICRHVKDLGMKVSSCGDDMLQFRRCLAASFFLNAAMRQADGSYKALASSLTVKIHPSSALFGTKPECIVFNELVQTQQKYVRNTTRIDPLWLTELAPKFYGCRQERCTMSTLVN
ncbi:pre-mRNA-splicing factor ATP-dependent RNA helicase DEAH10-like isoform X2 [Nymphaea colorata]|nr:pre-mRNA-splicing factor ATP-dependent RNA helicase DEAH10-like isoform X2 [Nymphaea colorata]XP_031499909.1 pre-mRNA-splicing factor ATP-dependent RNA helicase DEAH10-like isoform X2 [Nymphaea colorata]XP_031499910.1 pre-mRNA-splicing factor ATP-dependent RNA helicase DEAH10-like isoform X2 [Nymphaea colorata]XP_049936479.1 pre-mRNA-splicing factor ATP-dependent RNA helicase DEAH10-like isoform X2 [Nymphaea colorata]